MVTRRNANARKVNKNKIINFVVFYPGRENIKGGYKLGGAEQTQHKVV